MFGVELLRQIDVDLFARDDAFQLLGGLAMRIDHHLGRTL